MIRNAVIFLCIVFGPNTFASDIYEQYLSIIGFKLEKTNLQQIQDKLGKVPSLETKVAIGVVYTICYWPKNGKETIYFESSTMGGKNRQLLSFSVINKVVESEQCGSISTDPNSLHLGELKLGAKLDIVKKSLPQPVEEIAGWGYLHKHFETVPFSKKDIDHFKVKDIKTALWNVTTFIEVFEKDGLVTGYKVSKQTYW